MGNKDFDEWWDVVSHQTFIRNHVDADCLPAVRTVAYSAWLVSQEPLKAKIAELEEQMEAIGAGGVTRGQRLMSRKEQ